MTAPATAARPRPATASRRGSAQRTPMRGDGGSAPAKRSNGPTYKPLCNSGTGRHQDDAQEPSGGGGEGDQTERERLDVCGVMDRGERVPRRPAVELVGGLRIFLLHGVARHREVAPRVGGMIQADVELGRESED